MVRKLSLVPADLLKSTLSGSSQLQTQALLSLTNNFVVRPVIVGITPILIHNAVRDQNVMILNPSRGSGANPIVSGLLTTQILMAAAGNTQATPLAVANYLNMHIFLEVTAVAGGGSYTFWEQAQNPTTGTWFDIQAISAAIVAPINVYTNIAANGIATQHAVRWIQNVAGTISFSISYTLKYGLIGSASGISQIVYFGPNSGVSIVSGFPILEGDKEVFQISQGTQIWGIASVATVINVIELT